jgi:hypothetical protein
MSQTLQAAISSDIDTLNSIYKGQGCRRAGGYTYAELRMGLEEFARFLEPYGVQATLFMVGNDFQHTVNHDAIRSMVRQGHEIANHTMTHAQGFRLLSSAEKEAEIAGMETICEQVTGVRPRGFRSPGWNIGDDALPILLRRGYLYDSSVHPTSLMPLLKFLHWRSMSSRSGGERTTMGHMRYMFAPTKPYRTDRQSFAVKGQDGLVEFPVTVTPLLRLPFFATFLLATGLEFFERSYRALKARGYPIQFMFHLSDFVDYSHPELADQVPNGKGVYVPQALRTSLEQKLTLFRKAMDILAEDYTFGALAQWAESVGQESERSE